MPLSTAQTYILQALRKCGQIRPGYVSSPELLADGLTEWGSLFDSWAAERSMGFSVPQYQYAVNAPGSQQNGNGYLIGPIYSFSGTLAIGSPVILVADTSRLVVGEAVSGTGIPAGSTILSIVANVSITISANATATGAATVTATPDFVGPRPDSIIRANCVMTNVGPNPVYLHMRPISAEEWASLSIRQIPAINVTNLFYYDPQFPNGVLNVFPPLIGNAIELFTWEALGVPATLATPYAAPPGYQDAVIWSLAERLWPMCTKEIAVNRVPHAYICGKAYEACQKVRTVNRPVPALACDFRGGRKIDGYYDSFVSYTGEPY